MATLYRKNILLPGFPVQAGLLLPVDEVGFTAIRKTSSFPLLIPPTTPPMVGPGSSLHIVDRVIVLTAKHPGCRESGTEFNTTDGRNGKNEMRQHRFHRIEKRLAEAGGKTLHATLHDPPIRSFASMAFCNPLSRSVSPPISSISALMEIPVSNFFAMPPAATRPTVSRPLK